MPLHTTGFELLKTFIDAETAHSIIKEVDGALLHNKGGGIRCADKKFQTINVLASSSHLLSHASKYLNGKPKLVRAILFDKSSQNNWLVSWHQDKTIALSSKFESDDWGPWSLKEGIHHVQPPLELLESMVTFRIHLDDSTLKNGCLRIIPGSHLMGVLNQEKINQLTKSCEIKVIESPALSALVMRPHILHASSKAKEPSRRRILHLEYSSYILPQGVNWA